MWQRNLLARLGSRGFAIFFLVAITWLCFSRALGGNFLADDFSEIHYVWHVFVYLKQNVWLALLTNYIGQDFYRPWLVLTILTDFWLWKTVPFGYLLTNLVLLTGCVVLVHLVVARLTRGWAIWRSSCAALLAAAIFALNPLHCENVSWVVGRADLLACFYFLLAFLLFVIGRQSGRRLLSWLALASFVIALLAKEMAVGLPLLVAAHEFFNVDEHKTRRELPDSDWLGRVSSALRETLWFWVAIVPYFAVRALVLETPFGGYVGVIGLTLSQSMWGRWSDLGNIYRLLFPFSYAAFAGQFVPVSIVGLCYAVLLAALVLRLTKRDLSARWTLFLTVWIVVAIAPLVQVWGLGYNLEGGRYFLFLTVPLAIFWSVLVFHPLSRQWRQTSAMYATVLGASALVCLVATMGYAAVKTDLIWLSAGRELQALGRSCCQIFARSGPKDKFLILGLPKDRGGAHMLYNGAMFQDMLSPPFVYPPVFPKFATFEPFLNGPPQFINASRFKQMLASSRTRGVFAWSSQDREFLPITLRRDPDATSELPLTFESGGRKTSSIALQNVSKGDRVELITAGISPLDYDFLELDLKLKSAQHGHLLKISWDGQHPQLLRASPLDPPGPASAIGTFSPRDELWATVPIPETSGNSFAPVRVRLSRYRRWFAAGNISRLVLALPACEQIELRNPRLRPSKELVPGLRMLGFDESIEGAYLVPLGQRPELLVDAEDIPGSAAIELQVSRPDFFFDNLPQDHAGSDVAIAATGRRPIKAGKITVPAYLFPESSYYQIRVRAASSEGKPIGEFSDPVTLFLTQ